MDILDEHIDDIPQPNSYKESGSFSHHPKFVQFLMAISLGVILMMGVGLLAGYMTTAYYGMSTVEIINQIETFLVDFKGDYNCLRFSTMINTVVTFGGAALIMSYLITGRFLRFFHFNNKASLNSIGLIPLMMLSILPVIALVAYGVGRLNLPSMSLEMEAQLMTMQKGLIGVPSAGIFLINFLMIAILPAIFEELFFRGVLQRLLTQAFCRNEQSNFGKLVPEQRSRGHHFGIIITGLIFGAIHGQITNLLPISILGILLGYMYWWTKNIWYPIIAHLFFNGIQAFSFYMFSKNESFSSIEEVEYFPWYITLPFFLLFIGLTYLFFNLNKTTAYESCELG